MSNIIYLSIKGKIQGLISEGCGSYASIGNKYQINHVDEIFVLQFDHSLSREYNVVHHPIKFYKPIDKSSPLLNAALSENEELSAVFNFYRINSGGCIERFCTIPQAKFRKWDEMDVLLWMLGKNDSRRRSGVYYLNAYKDAYVQYNRDKIIKHAYAAGIRPELLGGVAWIESGGMPENYKFQIYETKRMMGLLDMPENKTSFGSMGIQIRTAAITLGLDPSELTTRNQLELATCLMEDDFTFQIAATYLRDLALFDYPSSATLYMTNEQYIMAGIRYNRGVERDLGFFIYLINNLPARDTDDYKFISYGMRLLEIREHIKKLINE